MTAVDKLGRVDELADGTGGSVDAVTDNRSISGIPVESLTEIGIASDNGEGEGQDYPSLSHGGLTMSRVMPTPPTPPQPTATRTTTPMPRYEQIARRAYQRWVDRGRPHGTDKQDWFEAETELKREMMGGDGRR